VGQIVVPEFKENKKMFWKKLKRMRKGETVRRR
jgi:hypothetical protein